MKQTRRKSNAKRGKNRLRTIVSTTILIIAAILYINQEILQSQSEQQHLSPEKLEQESQQNYHQETETGLEFPQMTGDEKLINYEGFTVCYNEKALIPHWVAYQMENYETDGETTRNGKKFRPDNALPYRQAEDDDYRNSGWARGHMAPAADFKWSGQAMSDTFYFTNCCPQNSSLNGGMWSTLEKKVRDAAVEYGSIWVITGPIVEKNSYGTIGNNNVIVPDAFFKAMLIYDGAKYHSIAFVMDNCKQKSNMQKCAMSVNDLEKRLQMNLFEALDNTIEETVESSYTLPVWNL